MRLFPSPARWAAGPLGVGGRGLGSQAVWAAASLVSQPQFPCLPNGHEGTLNIS